MCGIFACHWLVNAPHTDCARYPDCIESRVPASRANAHEVIPMYRNSSLPLCGWLRRKLRSSILFDRAESLKVPVIVVPIGVNNRAPPSMNQVTDLG